MEKPVTHKFLNSAVFTALLLPLAFFTLRDTIALLTQPLFLSIGGEDSFLYLINDDISRLIMAGLIVLVMPLYFRGKCDFGFRGGLVKLGLLLALPELIVPLWNLLQIKVYDAPLVTGTADLVVGAQCDIRALAVDVGDNSAGVSVKAVLCTGVTDVRDDLADDLLEIDIAVGGDLAHNVDQTGGSAGLAGHAGIGVVGQDLVQDSIGDLVADLVRMSLGDGLRSKQVSCHKFCPPCVW